MLPYYIRCYRFFSGKDKEINRKAYQEKDGYFLMTQDVYVLRDKCFRKVYVS
ncbi:hypothetical protein HMPREF9446_01433 [Bacteroides fluxus YIT 12057]|uniref:Uncharacterized protein n=1 Tax=Bacteroides fluxus YIT 12057 TaxID=763034 RepID=F3PRT2_9BACE|nr:hypothetical protein HMPREF9446_01433 [Bacteroides fluxus YIT 12057]